MDVRLARVLVACSLYSVVEYGYWAVVLILAFTQGGAALAGIVLLAQLLPAALLSPFLGSLGDRLPRGAALSGTYAIEGVFLAALAGLIAADAPLALVVLVSALATIVVSVGRPIHYAALPQLATTPNALVRANSATGLVDGIGVFVGPAVAGLLAQTFGFAAVTALCAAAMLLAAGLTVALRLPAGAADSDDDAGVLGGLAHVARDRAVLTLLLLIGLSFVVAGSFEILGVAFASVVLGEGESAQGVMMGAAGIGVLVGSAVAAGVVARPRLVPLVVLCLAAAGMPLLVMAGAASLAIAVLLVAVSGAALGLSGVASRTLIQRTTDDRLLARVFAVHEAVLLLGLALGAVVAPLLVAWTGANRAYVPIGVGLFVIALAAWPVLRSLDLRSVFRPDVLALLRRIPFLAAMSPPALDRLSQTATWVDVPAGTVVIRQGDHGDSFYVVDSGRLSVTVDGQQRGHQMHPGDGFGEIALLHDVPRTATITAEEPTRLLRVERDEFLAAVSGNPLAHSTASAHLERDAEPPA